MSDWMEIVVRSLISFLAVFFFTRMIGKRQLSQITFFEYAVGIALGDMAAMVADNESPIYHGLIPMAMYTALPILLSLLAMKSKVARNIVEGQARVLIKDSKVLEDNLKKERMSTDELLESLRKNSVFKLADVEFAVMESNGNVSVLLKPENQPITAKRMGLFTAPEAEPQTVIMDGAMIYEALATMGLNQRWLHTELEKQGVTLENVFLGQIDTNGQLSLDLFDDQLQIPPVQTAKLTYLTLKKVQADLELYALSTNDRVARRQYADDSKVVQAMIDKLNPYLTT